MSTALSVSRPPVATALGGLIAMAVGIGIGRFVYTPILPAMLAGLGLSKAAAGMIASANFAGYLVGAIGTARLLSLPGSRRTWLLGALIVSALTTAAMGLTTVLPAFLLLRFIGGAASALALILASHLVLDHLTEAGRPGLAAVHFAGVGGGIAVSAVLVAVLLAAGASWQVLWQASGMASLLAVVVLLPAGTEPPPAARTTQRHRTDPRLRRLTFAYGLFGFGYVITATFLVAIVRATPAIRALEPVIWVIVGLAAAPSVLLWDRLGHRLGIPTAYAIAAVAEALGVLASVVWPSAVGIFLAAVLVGGTFMGLTSLGLMRARELARNDAGQAMAAVTGAFGIGQIVGPLLAGILSDALGGFTAPSILAAGALVLAAWLVRD
jgi:predicted MFS family arabinose efflux permease